jgi:hypothetical protein
VAVAVAVAVVVVVVVVIAVAVAVAVVVATVLLIKHGFLKDFTTVQCQLYLEMCIYKIFYGPPYKKIIFNKEIKLLFLIIEVFFHTKLQF